MGLDYSKVMKKLIHVGAFMVITMKPMELPTIYPMNGLNKTSYKLFKNNTIIYLVVLFYLLPLHCQKETIMEAIQIIRIEHPSDGIGIFKTTRFDRNEAARFYKKHNDCMNTPQEDKLDLKKNDKNWFCAYKSIEQFKEWVDQEWVIPILESGFNILLLSVTEYQIGGHQVIFTKESIIKKEIVNSLFI
jgi:hypothetical protein